MEEIGDIHPDFENIFFLPEFDFEDRFLPKHDLSYGKNPSFWSKRQ